MQGIFTGSGGPITTIADHTGGDFGFGNTSINNSGTVASHSFGKGIFTGNGGPTTTLYSDFTQFAFARFPSLNDRGTVAFFGQLNMGEIGIFTGNGGPTTTIADISGPFSAVFPETSLNDSGTVAFSAHLDTPLQQGIFTGDGGPTKTIADTSGPFNTFSYPGSFYTFPSPSLNEGGTVAFVAFLDTGETGIFSGSGGPTTIIADSSGLFGGFGSPSLNDSGTVAFSAVVDTGQAGIFTGPDPIADEVISSGDTLFGSTVVGAVTFKESLNDAGQIAFIYQLADERRGIARADPLVIPAPEPGTVALLVAGLLGAVLCGARANRRGPCPHGASHMKVARAGSAESGRQSRTIRATLAPQSVHSASLRHFLMLRRAFLLTTRYAGRP